MYCRRLLSGVMLLAVTTTAANAIEVICVPGTGADQTIPHVAYSGTQTTFKAIVRGSAGSSTWSWNPGDGSPPYTGALTGDTYTLSQTHTYTGSIGDTYTATLTVTEDASSDSDDDDYLVALRDGSLLHNQTSVAIDKGLWYIHSTMIRSDLTGLTGTRPAGYWSGGYVRPQTAMCAEAFAIQGHLASGDYDNDPYVETAQRALDYVIYYLSTQGLSGQTAGDPDSNGNGFGLYSSGTSDTYASGALLMALAANRAPNRLAASTNPQVDGRTYFDVAQDIADYLAFGQSDPVTGSYRGGWRYTANQGSSDNDITRTAIMGLAAAETELGVSVPQFVKDELLLWTTFIQNSTTGGGGYSNPGATGIAKTSGLLCEFHFAGVPAGDPRVINALDYMGVPGYWGSPGTNNMTATIGSYWAMRGVRQGMSLYGYRMLPFTAPAFDWYTDPGVGVAPSLVATQFADGRWQTVPGYMSGLNAMCTAQAVTVLSESVIGPSQKSVTIVGVVGTPDPAAVDVTINDLVPDIKAAPLAWTATETADASGFLTVSNTTGAHASSVTLTAANGALAAGTHVATVSIADPNATNSPQTIDVTFDLRSPPVITLSNNTITFTVTEGDADPTGQSVTVADTNGDPNPMALAWTATESGDVDGWLTLTNTSGVSGEAVTLNASLGALTAGTYNAQVSVEDPNATNSPQTINASLVIQSRPEIDPQANTVTFYAFQDGTDPIDQSVVVDDANGDPNPISLAWTAAELVDETWLDLTGTTGGDGSSITFSVTTASLVAGNESATVSITDANANPTQELISVIFVIQSRPIISLSSSTIDFTIVEDDSNSQAQSVTVTDTNTGINAVALAWAAAENPDAGWLTLTDTSGVSGESATLTAARGSLTAGSYSTDVDVSDGNAGNTPQTITVNLTVQSKPEISLTPATINLNLIAGDPNPAPQGITVDDINVDPNPIALSWSSSENPDRTWLTLVNGSGLDGESEALSIALSSLAAGNYSTNVEFADSNASNTPQATSVSLTVQSRPIITLSQSVVDFGITVGDADPAPLNVTISDTNSAANPITLAWTATEAPDASWLTLTNAAGASGNDVTLTVAGAGVPTGVNIAHVDVIDGTPGATAQKITVRFTVTPVGGFPDISSFIGDGCAAGTETEGSGLGSALFYILAAGVLAAAAQRRRRRASV